MIELLVQFELMPIQATAAYGAIIISELNLKD
jgi:hypothetical protein